VDDLAYRLQAQEEAHRRAMSVMQTQQAAMQEQIQQLQQQLSMLSKRAIAPVVPPALIPSDFTPPPNRRSMIDLLAARRASVKPPEEPPLATSASFLELLPSHLLLDQQDLHFEEPVGEGAFGKVWRATFQGKLVAVKVFLSDELDVLQEATMLDRVKDLAHVVKFIGIVWLAGGALPQVAVVTQFMANQSLYDIVVDRSSPLYQRSPSMLFLLKMAMQAAKGVRNLHRHNVIHRDLAARNLLLDDKMDVHVADFGFARLRESHHSKEFSKTHIGPVKWEAPESLRNKEYSEKTDVFSFGVTMYEIFVQRLPWEGLLATNVAYRVQNGERLKLPINMDPVVGTLMQRTWLESPNERPTMEEVHSTLACRHHQMQNIADSVQYEVECMHKLIKGTVLTKLPYGIGKPKDRFYRISEDMRSLIWSPTTSARNLSAKLKAAKEKSIKIETIEDVRIGRHTKNFKKYATFGLDRPAFSIITLNRTLDLLCRDPEELNCWSSSLKFCINRLKPDAESPIDFDGPMSAPVYCRMNSNGPPLQIGINDQQLYRNWCVLSELRRGWFLLKFGRNHRPHERFFRLSKDMRSLEWSSHSDKKMEPKEKKLLMSQVFSLQRTPAKKSRLLFASKGSVEYKSDFAFSLVGKRKRELITLVAPNKGQYLLWTEGLDLVIEELQSILPTQDDSADDEHFEDTELGTDDELMSMNGTSRSSLAGSFRKVSFTITPTISPKLQKSKSINYMTGDAIGVTSGVGGTSQTLTPSNKSERLSLSSSSYDSVGMMDDPFWQQSECRGSNVRNNYYASGSALGDLQIQNVENNYTSACMLGAHKESIKNVQSEMLTDSGVDVSSTNS